LTAQERRSATSISSNIAEGLGRAQTPRFLQVLRTAHGRLRETETQIQLAVRLNMVAAQDAGLAETTSLRFSKMLLSRTRTLEQKRQH
jgi:four helix bundle protein